MSQLAEFECTWCGHITTDLVDDDVDEIVCPECPDGEMRRLEPI